MFKVAHYPKKGYRRWISPTNKPTMTATDRKDTIDRQIVAVLPPELSNRFKRVVEKSQRSKTSIVIECLEKALPRLERKYETD